jgi:polysaccharide biosynthesis transport protein
VSLIQFLRILWARKAIILATFLGCLIAALLTVTVLPERYQAHSKVMLDVVKPDPVTGQVIATNFLRAYTSTQIELIKDMRTAGRVVDQLGWANNPALVARFSRENTDPGADVRQWLSRQISDGTEPRMIEGSNILDIVYTGDSPESARQLAELIRTAYIEQALEQRRESAGKSADWYREQSEKAKKALEFAEGARTKFAKENGIAIQANNVDIDSAKLDALNQQSVAVLNTPIIPAAPAVTVAASPAQMQLDQLDQQIAQAATTLGANHPTFEALQRQRRALAASASRQQVIQAPSRGSGGGGAQKITSAFEAQRSRVIANREKLDKLDAFQREVDLKKDQYQKAAQRASELRLEADTGEAGMSILGPPSTSDKPSFPNIPLVVGASIAFGLGLGVLLGLLVELLNRRVRSDDDLADSAHAPVLAIVGISRNPDGMINKLIRLIDRRKRQDITLVPEAAE